MSTLDEAFACAKRERDGSCMCVWGVFDLSNCISGCLGSDAKCVEETQNKRENRQREPTFEVIVATS